MPETEICFLFLGNIIETETETVFKGGGGSLRKFWDKILFLLVSVSNSYEVCASSLEHPELTAFLAHEHIIQISHKNYHNFFSDFLELFIIIKF